MMPLRTGVGLALICGLMLVGKSSVLGNMNPLQENSKFLQLKASTEGPAGRLNQDPNVLLVGMDELDQPVYYETHSVLAAHSMHLDEVWPGGSSGYNQTGVSEFRLGIWDSGRPLTTHQELVGKTLAGDSSPAITAHATSVAGIMIGRGLVAGVSGMAPGAQLKYWDWSDDLNEIMEATFDSVLVTNHSYGSSTGWYYQSPSWYWYGNSEISQVEDAKFGFYSSVSRAIDEITWLQQDYVMVRSAGNHRQEVGPAVGIPHFFFLNNTWISSLVVRDPDGGADGYESLGQESVAKNALIIGAALDMPNGWTNPADVVVTTYSSFGPTDDGRIKPDLVASGNTLLTASRTSDTSYAYFSGTSASSPVVAGLVALLQSFHRSGHTDSNGIAANPSSATIRGLLIHTADEAGLAAGPDYQSGWGYVNARAAADLIAQDIATRRRIMESTLGAGQQVLMRMRATGGPVRLTLAWTDFPAVVRTLTLDDPTPRLVHDLNLSCSEISGGVTHQAWALNPSQPAAPAQAVGNHRDNVEVVEWVASAGTELYAQVDITGPMQAVQPWSLLWSGVEPVAELMVSVGRVLLQLGDTLQVDFYLEGGLAVTGARLKPSWPTGALRLISAEAGGLLTAGNAPVSVLMESEVDHAVVNLIRTGDHAGLNLPSGVLARLRFVVQTGLQFEMTIDQSRLWSAAGETGHALSTNGQIFNQGMNPADLELLPQDLPQPPAP